ncbi:unnamed protein product [Arabidopsis thaliana]|uniref:Uncharacterized protein n=1 Tax=Arabidopsis thaliana TaxID=3702 RepID=A0A5S9Y070_ARATH|nr:unnamed protein product [Arabidopsis thaliana]
MLSDFSDIGFSSSFRIITLADGFGSVRLARGKIDEDSSEIIVALRQTEQETSVIMITCRRYFRLQSHDDGASIRRGAAIDDGGGDTERED